MRAPDEAAARNRASTGVGVVRGLCATGLNLRDTLIRSITGLASAYRGVPVLNVRDRGSKIVATTVDVRGSPVATGETGIVEFAATQPSRGPGCCRDTVREPNLRGDFRGTGEWTFDPVDDTHTRVAFRWCVSPAGLMRLWSRLVDVPGSHSQIMHKGFAAMDKYLAARRVPG